MKAARQAAMVKSVAKSMRYQERKSLKEDKARTRLSQILRRVGKSLDEVVPEDLTAKEYREILEIIPVIWGYDVSPTYYENLHKGS